MNPRSNKAKGRRLQQVVRDKILETYPELEKDDVKSTAMGQAGTDVQLSPAAKRLLPVDIECKNIARFVGYTFIEQSEKRSSDGRSYPIAVVKANRKRPLVLMYLEDYLNLTLKHGNHT